MAEGEKPAAAAPPPAAAAPAEPPKAEPPAAGRRADDRAPVAAAPKKPRRKHVENVVGAFILAMLVGGALVWTQNANCPGAFRAAALLAAPLAVPVAVVLAGIIARADKQATQQEQVSRGISVLPWAAIAAVVLLTGILMVMNERGPRSVNTRKCLVSRRETVPARVAGVGEWLLVLECSAEMSPVRVEVDRRTWWDHEAGGTIDATVARGRFGFEWVIDTELGPPVRGFTSW